MRPNISALAACAAIAVLCLSGCGSSVGGSAQAVTNATSSPTPSPSTRSTARTSTSAPSASATGSSSASAADLDPVTATWFTTYCRRLADASQYATDLNEDTVAAAQAAVVGAYTNISASATATVAILAQTPPPAVSGGGDLQTKAIEYFTIVSDVYGRGARTIAGLAPTDLSDLESAKDAIEAEATASIPEIMSHVQSDVLAAARALPDCQKLSG